jgi:3-hydroxyisobutyrate dehydrogenase-like beta-hydroxyacid dehydrogenase
MKVSVIGVGAMGAAMAGHLVRAGHEVTGFDVDPARAEAVAQGGATFANRLEDAASAEMFVVMVVSDAQSIEVVDALSGMAPQGALIAIAATNHPDTMKGLAHRAGEGGMRLIDAPVCFGLQGAVDGELVSLCGGSEADVEFARPVLTGYSREVYHVGPLGTGQLAKACNNMLHWAACVANFEVLLLAKRFGVNAQHMREILHYLAGKGHGHCAGSGPGGRVTAAAVRTGRSAGQAAEP